MSETSAGDAGMHADVVLADIVAARARIAGGVERTPCVHSPALSQIGIALHGRSGSGALSKYTTPTCDVMCAAGRPFASKFFRFGSLPASGGGWKRSTCASNAKAAAKAEGNGPSMMNCCLPRPWKASSAPDPVGEPGLPGACMGTTPS